MKNILKIPKGLTKAYFSVIALLIIFLLNTSILFAQSLNPNPSNPSRGVVNGASYSVSDIENINLTNGNLMMNIPLATLPAGRGGMNASIGLMYNSKLYDTSVEELPDLSNRMSYQNILVDNPTGGWKVINSLDYQIVLRNRQSTGADIPCHPTTVQKMAYIWKMLVIFPDGKEVEFRPVGYTDYFNDGYFNINPNGQQLSASISNVGTLPDGTPSYSCNTGSVQRSTPLVYYSTDGSYLRLTQNNLYFPDGSKYDFSNKRLTDRNGNYLEKAIISHNGLTGSGVRDQFDRKIFQRTVAGETLIYMVGFNNVDLVCTIKWKNIHVRKPYETTGSGSFLRGGTSNQVVQMEFRVVDEILLPEQLGGVRYQFEYNGSDTELPANVYSTGWGELSSVVLPSEATAQYEFKWDGTPLLTPKTHDILANSIEKKTLSYNSEYDGVISPTSDIWNYSIGKSGSGVISPDGSSMSQIHGNTSTNNIVNGLVFEIENSNGTKVEKLWDYNVPTVYTNSYQKPVNPFVKAEFTSIKDSSGSYVLTAIKEFGYDKNGNQTVFKEYDFVPYTTIPRDQFGRITGIPGGAPVKRISENSYYNPTEDASNTTTNNPDSYWNTTTGNVKNALKSTTVKQGNGTVVSHSEIIYDDAGNTANPTEVKVWDSYKNGTYQAFSSPLTINNSISTTMEYDSYGNATLTSDAKGNQTKLTYDSINGFSGLYPTKTEAAFGTSVKRTSTMQYDFSTGLPTSVTDVDNNLTNATEYDALGRPVKSKTAVGTALEVWTQTEYDNVNRRVIARSDLFTKGDGKKIAVQHFDELGRVRLSRSIENAATEDPYNENDGIKVQTRYQTGNPYSYALSSNPYRAATSGAAGGEESMGWTRSKSVNTGKHSEVETFTGAGLPAPWGSNSNSTGVVATDVDANRTLVTDQAGKQRISKSNALGQLTDIWEIMATSDSSTVAVTFPNQSIAYGYQTSYVYDTLNNLTTVNQGSQTRSFSYSSLSRLKSAANPESGTISYGYDDNGNLTGKTDGRSVVTSYTYDALNRVLTRNYTGEPTGLETPNVTYTYDNLPNAKGQLIKVENSLSKTEYTQFDILGRVTKSKQTTDGTAYNEMEYTYNLSGAMTEQKYPSGRVVRNVLDNDGDLSIVQSKKNQSAGYWDYAKNFTYTAAGAVSSMQLGNGKWESTSFNSRLQPTKIALGTVQSGDDKLNLVFNYGTTANNGNVLSQTINVQAVGANQGFTAVQNYTYDSLNRLKSAVEYIDGSSTASWKQSYTFDRYGNRRFDEANTNTIESTCPTAVCNPTIDPATNKLIGYQFDASGNTKIDAENRQFIYDGENKQVEVLTSNNVSLGKYFYDGDGKRVKKISATETTIFVYNAGGQLVAEYSPQIAQGQDAKVSYLTNDHLGSPRITTDANGQVVSRRDFQPFGEEIQRAGYGADSVRQKFTSYERDDETDLDFAQARYFDSGFGRFSSPDDFLNDTIPAEPSSWNLYVYTRNNPLNFVDSMGEDIEIYEWIIDEKGKGSFGKNPLYYRGNKLYTRDGKEYEGTNDYALSVLNDLNQLKEDEPYVAFIIRTLENSDQIHRIMFGEGSPSVDSNNKLATRQGLPAGSSMYYDPSKKLANKEAGPKRIDLAHELSHSFDTDQGENSPSDRRPTRSGAAANEVRARRVENRVRDALGFAPNLRYMGVINPYDMERFGNKHKPAEGVHKKFRNPILK